MPDIESIRWSKLEDEETVDSLFEILEAPETIRPVAIPQSEPMAEPTTSRTDGFRSVISAGLFFGLVMGLGLRALAGGQDVATATAMTDRVVSSSSRALAAAPPSPVVDEPQDGETRPPDADRPDPAERISAQQRRARRAAKGLPAPLSETEPAAEADEVYDELDELSATRTGRKRKDEPKDHRTEESERGASSAERD